MSGELGHELVEIVVKNIIQPIIEPPPTPAIENYDFQDGANYEFQDLTNYDFN